MNYFMMRRILDKNKRKVYHHVDPGISLIIIPVAFFGTIVTLGGILNYIVEKEKEESKPSFGYEQSDDDVKTFEPGEHIISVLTDSPIEEAQQYEYHEGYKPLGIATATYGKATKHDAGSCILYINDQEVLAKANGMKDGELYFGDFGTPLDFENSNGITENIYTVDFPAGTHILSMPVDDPTEYNMQFETHEGYEPVGIATAAYGKATDISSGGCILYVNTDDVTLQKNDDGVYTEFGTPSEKVYQKNK